MTYKFVDISSLFERFALDAFDLISGMKDLTKEKYTGYFGDSPREIYAKVVQNKVETKAFVRAIDRHEYGFAQDVRSTMYRYFLPLDALKELEKDFVSFEEKDKIENFLYKFGKFSDFDDFEFFHLGTLTSGDNNGLIGITDYGDEVRGKFFRPLRKGEGLTIKGIKVPVPDLNINPIPSLPKDAVDEAIENFDKEVENSEKSERMKEIQKNIRDRSNALYGSCGSLVPLHQETQYSVYKNTLYKYTGDFKYEDQIKEILEEVDFLLIAKMAIIKYTDLESTKAMYDPEELAIILKNDAEEVLRDLVKENCGRVGHGLFTAHNDGGWLSLEFTPEGWEGSVDEENYTTEETELDKIKF